MILTCVSITYVPKERNYVVRLKDITKPGAEDVSRLTLVYDHKGQFSFEVGLSYEVSLMPKS